jgi:hypothetical protein
LSDLERVRAALGRIVDAPVEVLPRGEWDAGLRPGGRPTRLPEPFGPYLGVQGNPSFECAIASGAPHADEPGFHYVRRDEKDLPEGRYNTDSHVVIVDLVADPRWPEVLRVTGPEDTDDLRALAHAHVFAHVRQRDDHWSRTIPDDISGAEPKDK